MYRGTTPTLTFRLPIDTGSITVLSLAVAQAGQVKIEKSIVGCTAGRECCLLHADGSRDPVAYCRERH